MAGSLLPEPKQQFLNDIGDPLFAGQIFTYAAGTLTPKSTYQDQALTIANTNPIVANARGEVVMYGSGNYRVILKDSFGNTIYDRDNISTSDEFSNLLRSDLALSSGASLIGYIQAGIGAVGWTVQDKLRESVSVTDYMTVEQRAAAKDSASTLDHTDAFMRAYNASNTVTVPPGFYNVENLKFNKNNFSLIGAGYNQSILRSKAAAGICIEVANTANVSGLRLKDFKIEGTAAGAGGIKLGSEGFYCAIPMLENVNVWDYSRVDVSGFGIQLFKVQNVSIHNCFIYRNRYALHHPNGGFATSTRISGKSGYLGGGFVGVYVDGFFDDLYIEDVVIEGNSSSGVVVTANAVRDDRGSNIFISGAYFEANGSDGSGVVAIQGSPGQYQKHVVVIEKSYFAANAMPFVRMDNSIYTIKNNKLAPNEVVTSASCSGHFSNNIFPTATDFLAAYRALLGNVSVTDKVVPNLETDLNQLNYFNAITFPAVPRLVSDEHTLDDYREKVTGQWAVEYLGFAGTITGISGQYVKIGRIIHFELLISGSALGATWTASRVFLPIPTDINTVCSIFNATTGTSAGGAYIDRTQGAILLPTMAPSDAVLVLSGTYIAKD